MKVTKVHLILALIQPFPFWMVHWCFPPKLNVFLFHSILFFIPLSFSYSLFISLSTSHFCSTWGHFYVAWFIMIFRSFDQITTLTYFNLNLRSYGQLFVLVYLYIFILASSVGSQADLSSSGSYIPDQSQVNNKKDNSIFPLLMLSWNRVSVKYKVCTGKQAEVQPAETHPLYLCQFVFYGCVFIIIYLFKSSFKFLILKKYFLKMIFFKSTKFHQFRN